jgi:hypothetical protein
MKVFGGITLAISLFLAIWGISAEVFADFEYENSVGSYWSLSEKASSLDAKADYLNRFVTAVEGARLEGNNAIFLKTPNNSIEQNMVALRSLQKRMNEIKSMDVTSFAYQQAIQQITAQEQGEASNLLGVIEGKWYLDHHFLLWDWIDILKWIFIVAGLIVGGIALALGWDD